MTRKPLSRLEEAAVVAEAERRTGVRVTSVEYVEIAPLIATTCGICGVPIRMLCIRRCDDCMRLGR